MLNEFENTINGLLEARNAEISVLESNIKAAEEAERIALEATANAYEAADVKEYHKSQDAARTSKDAVDMYSRKLAELKRTPVVNAEEHKAMKGEIMAAIQKEVEEARRTFVAAIDKASESVKALSGEIEKGNRLLHALQHDLALDDACIVGGNGQRVHVDSKEDRWTDYALFEYVRKVKSHPLYKGDVNNE